MLLKVIVHPSSKLPRLQKDLLGDWHVYVHEPPLGGRANEAVIKTLAGHFKVAKSSVRLLRGATAKVKYFEL
jgi:uncharacterized protein